MFLLILEREGAHERETSILVASRICPTEAGTSNLGMCPDWELNPQPFAVWDDAPTNSVTWLEPEPVS